MQKRALITGAGQRIGKGIALDLAQKGWDVVLHYHRSQVEALTLAAEITGMGRKAIALAADLSDEAQAAHLVETATHQLGPLSCLINNAAAFIPDTPATVSHNTWHTLLNTNSRAPLILSQNFAQKALNHLTPDLPKLIINISDQMALKPNMRFASYSLSKQLLDSITRLMAKEFAPHVRVNGISLGLVMANVGMPYSDFEAMCQNTPLKRATQLDEICRCIQLIMECPSMTGSIIPLESGMTL